MTEPSLSLRSSPQDTAVYNSTITNDNNDSSSNSSSSSSNNNNNRKKTPKPRKTRGVGPNHSLETNTILFTACFKWLNVPQIIHLLDPKTTPLTVVTRSPSSPPPSGTLLLYDRSATRRYKDDGYRWVKKRNSNKVREDHVKLRVGGQQRVSGAYVHGLDNPTLHRRAYHMLVDTNHVDNGTTSNATVSSPKQHNSQMHGLVLLHYLDTSVAGTMKAKIMQQPSTIDETMAMTMMTPSEVTSMEHPHPDADILEEEEEEKMTSAPSYNYNNAHNYHKEEIIEVPTKDGQDKDVDEFDFNSLAFSDDFLQEIMNPDVTFPMFNSFNSEAMAMGYNHHRNEEQENEKPFFGVMSNAGGVIQSNPQVMEMNVAVAHSHTHPHSHSHSHAHPQVHSSPSKVHYPEVTCSSMAVDYSWMKADDSVGMNSMAEDSLLIDPDFPIPFHCTSATFVRD